jgi:hypothetical protein
MPGDFSARGGTFLNRTDGTIIGEEQRIIVNHAPDTDLMLNIDKENQWDEAID